MNIKKIGAAIFAAAAITLSLSACGQDNQCPQGQSAVYDDGEFEGCTNGNFQNDDDNDGDDD